MNTGRRRLALWVVVVLVVLGMAVAGARRGSDGPPLDPRSTGELGTRGLVLLLRDLGVEVEIDRPGVPADGVVLLLVDTLDGGARDQLRAFVEQGGIVVTTDPRSPLLRSAVAVPPGDSPDEGIPERRLRRRCDVEALAGVDTVRPGGTARFTPAPDAVGCFADDGGAFVVVEPRGRGAVVAVASPLVWVNQLLGDDDNSVLAGALLAPRPGRTVTFFEPPRPGAGDEGLVDVLPDRVPLALAQFAFAFVLLVLWRARRLGAPVLEPQPVELAGSDFVIAVGHLLQQGRQRDAAAELIRQAGRADVAERLGLTPDTPSPALVASVAERTGRPLAAVHEALDDTPVGSDADLVALAQTLDSIRQEVAHAR